MNLDMNTSTGFLLINGNTVVRYCRDTIVDCNHFHNFRYVLMLIIETYMYMVKNRFAWRCGWICLKWFSCWSKKEAMLVKQHFDWEVRRLGMVERVKTRNDYGLRIWIFSQKMPFSVGKKMFQRQIQEVQYTIPIRHMTNIPDFVWFQRSCGSMKSVSSFSSIDIKNAL